MRLQFANELKCSNRTFMELKFALQKYKEVQESSSNRTFMELKWAQHRQRRRWADSSNRTFMELKWMQPPPPMSHHRF